MREKIECYEKQNFGRTVHEAESDRAGSWFLPAWNSDPGSKIGCNHVTGRPDAYIKEMPVVVIDAGHGGTDPGKVGVDGSLEKDINLAVAKRLKTYLEQDDIRVIMTRETDTGLYSDTDSRKKMADMKKRCEIIEESGADLVVSIHQNSYHEESVSGGQVFYYRDSAKGQSAGGNPAEKVQLCPWRTEQETSEGKWQLLSSSACEMSDRDRGVRVSEQPKGSRTFEQRGISG